MTKEEAIKYLQQIYPNGGYCWLDNQRIEAIGMAIQALQEEPVSNSDWLTELQEKLDNATPEQLEELWNKYNGVDEEEPVSEDLEEAAIEICSKILKGETVVIDGYEYVVLSDAEECFKAGTEWQKANLWKPADGDDLPEIDREVIALLDNGKVVFAHRPPEYWDGKDIVTGKVTRNYPKTYDKGGWNIPNIVLWLDVELPKEIE